ncbi:hypothetical protein [Paenibacillus luteus]|uniref:hypothetical protein n=1 Tax=Paenibacillus luteus TaxID=2545753 RepID=UPI001143B614|nr:hypothetical protein [Paenibacillus luteus]
MEKHTEMIEQIIELAETCLYALEYIQQRLSDGYLEDAIRLFCEWVEVFFYMEKSIQILPVQKSLESLVEASLALHNTLEKATAAFEQNNRNMVQSIVQYTLRLDYMKWKVELEQIA